MEQVLAVLFEFVNASEGLVVIKSMASMSIEECLELARMVNSTDPNHLMVCAPDLSLNTVTH